MLDKLKYSDYWRHLWRPFWIFSYARIVRRTPGSDSAPPNYRKRPGCRLFRKNGSRTLFKHIIKFPNQSTWGDNDGPQLSVNYLSMVSERWHQSTDIENWDPRWLAVTGSGSRLISVPGPGPLSRFWFSSDLGFLARARYLGSGSRLISVPGPDPLSRFWFSSDLGSWPGPVISVLVLVWSRFLARTRYLGSGSRLISVPGPDPLSRFCFSSDLDSWPGPVISVLVLVWSRFLARTRYLGSGSRLISVPGPGPLSRFWFSSGLGSWPGSVISVLKSVMWTPKYMFI